MARYVYCPQCAARLGFPEKSSTREHKYFETGEVESERFVWGQLLLGVVCDGCATTLSATRALAYTIETPARPVPYWEHNYLDPEPQPIPQNA